MKTVTGTNNAGASLGGAEVCNLMLFQKKWPAHEKYVCVIQIHLVFNGAEESKNQICNNTKPPQNTRGASHNRLRHDEDAHTSDLAHSPHHCKKTTHTQ